MQFPTTLIVARGAAIALVLLFHAQIFLFDHNIAFGPYWKLVSFIGYMLMPLLFLLSGLSMPFLLVSRAAIYLYLFVLWSLIYFTFNLLFRDGVAALDFDRLLGLLTHLLVPRQSILWFLYALFLYIVVARIIARISAAHQLAISVVMGWLVEFIPLHYATREIIQSFVFFLIGLHYRTQLTTLFSQRAKLGVLVAGGAYCAVYAGARWARLDSAPLLNEILGLLGVAAALYACRLVAMTPLRHVFRPIGRHILQIYLLHLLMFEAIWYAGSGTSAAWSDLPGAVAPFALAGAALAGSIAASRLLRNVPGLFVAPDWALRILTPPLERLVEVASMPGDRMVRSSTPKAPH